MSYFNIKNDFFIPLISKKLDITRLNKYIARKRKSDGVCQSLEDHLIEVGEIASTYTAKIGLPNIGNLLGLMHDFGKYRIEFQNYIKSATGEIKPGEDAYLDPKKWKGKVDHSTAGAQWIWNELNEYSDAGSKCCIEILALCILSHHSGLIDCITEHENNFKRRIHKNNEIPDKSYPKECEEVCKNISPKILSKARSLISECLVEDMKKKIQEFGNDNQHGQKISETIKYFYVGFWTRFLFSCLIDADRTNSADFENPKNKQYRCHSKPDWELAIKRMESFLSSLPVKSKINSIRQSISDECRKKATEKQGVYSLTVPTGGGKTYTSLRYALHHAKAHKLDRIIYVIPYTSIIDQNAEAIRKVLEQESDCYSWVLEHHSNLEPEQQTWYSKLMAENWDAPIVLTTMVQFLEVLFGNGTRGARRIHQLANSIIIFDEIQTLPIKCVHLFCNSLNFLSTYAKTTAVLCTATQPLLNKLKYPEKGQVFLPKENDLINNKDSLFEELERVQIFNKVSDHGWDKNKIMDLATLELNEVGSCLIIVNTKKWASVLYEACSKLQSIDTDCVFHLSTYQCSKHRKKILQQINKRLKENKPVLCISTQLIEAGVDVDFGSVIRFLAGLDSIVQAAGRCNRNGNQRKSKVYIINPKEEFLDSLPDIEKGCDATRRIMREETEDNMLSPGVMKKYFQYYFYDRSDEMGYPISLKGRTTDNSLLDLLSDNKKNIVNSDTYYMRQSFKTAADKFKAIEAPTESIIVPYEKEGKRIIKELCNMEQFNSNRYYDLLKEGQQYSVNLFPKIREKLLGNGTVKKVQNEGIYYLCDERFYSDTLGLVTEPINQLEFLEC